MRQELKQIEDVRKTFIATFKRYGAKTSWHGFLEKTILLIDTKDENGKIVANHIWFSNTKGFQKLGELKEGNKIQFDARVKDYIKGYVRESEFIDERKIDYKLNNPTKIRVLM